MSRTKYEPYRREGAIYDGPLHSQWTDADISRVEAAEAWLLDPHRDPALREAWSSELARLQERPPISYPGEFVGGRLRWQTEEQRRDDHLLSLNVHGLLYHIRRLPNGGVTCDADRRTPALTVWTPRVVGGAEVDARTTTTNDEPLHELLHRLAWRGREGELALVEWLTPEVEAAIKPHLVGLSPRDQLGILCHCWAHFGKLLLGEDHRALLVLIADIERLKAIIGPMPPSPRDPAVARRPLLRAVPRHRQGVWGGTYLEYMATPAWRRLAAQLKREWNYQCAINANHRGPVEMHHRTYRGVPFGETWQEVIPLCEDCHALYHLRLPAPPRGLFDEITEEPTLRKAA